MLVKELIEKLKDADPNAEVRVVLTVGMKYQNHNSDEARRLGEIEDVSTKETWIQHAPWPGVWLLGTTL